MNEQPYPLAALASRKAPRLFAVNGAPTLTHDEQRFLREADQIADTISNAQAELETGLENEDAVLCAAVARRFLAIGAMFAGKAVEAGL